VVDPPDERHAAVLQIHHVQAPERMGAIQSFTHQAADDLQELGPVGRTVGRHPANVPGDVEVRVVCPHRRSDRERGRDEPAPETRRGVQLRIEVLSEFLDARRIPALEWLQVQDLAHVAPNRPTLETENLMVLRTEPIEGQGPEPLFDGELAKLNQLSTQRHTAFDVFQGP
jgi:hypothetical protein